MFEENQIFILVLFIFIVHNPYCLKIAHNNYYYYLVIINVILHCVRWPCVFKKSQTNN